MDKKNMKLPKSGLVEPEEARFIDDTDVEGHGLPLTPPPSAVGPTHGGENIPTTDEDDVEGHRINL